MRPFVRVGMATISICVFLAGCGDAPKDTPTSGEVTGTVTLDGKPLSSVTVEFYPDNTKSTNGPKSTAVADYDGKFTLFQAGNVKGAVVGFHKVTVACPPPAGQTSSPDGKSPPPAGEPCDIPVKFGKVESSGISKEVLPGKNEIAIELKSET